MAEARPTGLAKEDGVIERFAPVVLVALLTYLVYLVFAPFLGSLIWAVILVVFFQPLHARLLRVLRRPGLAALATTLLLVLLVILPVLFVFITLGTAAVGFAQHLTEGWKHGAPSPLDLLHRLPLKRLPISIDPEQLKSLAVDSARNLAGVVANSAQWLVANVLATIASLALTLLASFFLFRDGPLVMRVLRDVAPLDPDYRDRLLRIIGDVLYVSVVSTFAVALVQGTLGGLAFWGLGLPSPLLWGSIMALTSLVPLVGSAIVWAPAATYLIATGDWMKGVLLILVGTLVIGTIDNVLRPLLMTGHAELNGLLVLIAALGGVAAFGMLGIVLGPVLVALAVAIIEAHRESRRQANGTAP